MKKHVLYSVLSALLSLCSSLIAGSDNPLKVNGSRSICFTENKGQIHDQFHKPRPDVLYGVASGNLAVHIKRGGVSYQLQGANNGIYRIDLNWLNHNAAFTATENEALPGYEQFYLESCPNGALFVKSYRAITLKSLYDGIDLHYYEKDGELKHDYIVAPHADYKQIRVSVEGADVSVKRDGSLILSTPFGKVQEGAPLVYQNNKQLKAVWRVKNNILSFNIEDYDPNSELIIDPVTRLWGTYYGGLGDEYGWACSTDGSGNVYLSGTTQTGTGTIIATSGSHQSTYSFLEAYLVKFNANGVRQWATYYGGSGGEQGFSCATDASGNVYLAGETSSNSSTVIATPGSHQPSGSGGINAFLVKFNSSGVRQWGTYYGGNAGTTGHACYVDAPGNVYLVGRTTSSVGIATAGAHQTVFATGTQLNPDAFLVKFNSSGVIQWGTYYGGSGIDYGQYCSVDVNGNVYLSGWTGSTVSIATSGSHQSSFGGQYDGFLVKFDANGTRQWGTYYGGAGDDKAMSCSNFAGSYVYLTGVAAITTGSVLATPGTHQTILSGSADAFLAKFDSTGVRQWGTYYGGAGGDFARASVILSTGDICIAGETTSTYGIATNGSHQAAAGTGLSDGFLAKFSPAGLIKSATFYGGAQDDYGFGCAADASDNMFLSGTTDTYSGTAIASLASHQPTLGGGTPWGDGFLAKFAVCNEPPAPLSIVGSSAICSGSISSSFSVAPVSGANFYVWSLPPGSIGSTTTNIITFTASTSGTVKVAAANGCGASKQQTLGITVNPSPTVTVNSGSVCAGSSFTLIPAGATSYSYSAGPVVSPSVTSGFTVVGTNSFGCTGKATSTVIVHPLPFVSVSSGVICLGKSFTMTTAGASTYTYSSGPVVTPTVTTSYSVRGTSAAGCLSSNTAISTVTVSTLHPTITVNSGSVCLGNNFTIAPSGADYYNIQGGLYVVKPTTTTSYSVTGTSSAGCAGVNTVFASVTVQPLPFIQLSTSQSSLCLGQSATLTAYGGVSYTFYPGGSGQTIVISPTGQTTYVVAGKDSLGCQNTASLTQYVDLCVGLIQHFQRSGSVRLYPNPAEGTVHIQLDSPKQILLLDATGRIVLKDELPAGSNQIVTDRFAKGVYIVVVKGSEDTTTLRLIIE